MSVYKRASGRYQVRIDQLPDAAGKRKRKALGTYRTRKEAEAAERTAIEHRDRGTDIAAGTETVAGLLGRYIADREPRCAESTIERYRELAKGYIEPRIGSVTLARLRPAHISTMVTELSTSGSRRGGALTSTTVAHAYTLLSGALSWAVRLQVLHRNPALAVDAPRPQRRETEATPPDTIRRILDATAGSPWPWMRRFVIVAASTGARRGELGALKRDAIDLTRAEVTFRASLSQTRTGIKVKGTKTGSTRTVPLAQIAVAALREQFDALERDHELAGSAYQDQGFVFAAGDGRPIAPMVFTDAFRNLCRRAGVKGVRLHDMRHALGSWLIGTGTDPKTVSSILGHSTPTTTLRIYAHLIAGAKTEAIGRLEGMFAAATGSKPVGESREPLQ